MTEKELFESSDEEPREDGSASAVPAEQTGIAFARLLRSRREERGLSLDDCGRSLRLPVRLLRQLETGNYSGIDYQVYLRGYLIKYGHCVGVSDTDIEAELHRLTPRQPALVSTGGISRSRYLLERYAQAASYIVLTVVILVPVVWFGLRGGLQKGANLMPLDSAPVAVRGKHDTSPEHRGAHTNAASGVPGNTGGDREPQPLLASIAPFAAMRADAPQMEAATASPSAAATQSPLATPGQGLSIHLDQPSWVQVTSSQGKRLEYGLLPAGTEKTYEASDTGSLNVRIGNADAATVTVAGRKVDLARYQHANVAHFDVNVRNGKTTQTDN